MFDQKDLLCVNSIRFLSVDAIEKAKSGHPGLPLGAAPMAYVLWKNHLRHNPSDPKWPDRDRFILSAGHGSMLLYSLLHLSGYDLSLDEIKNFRQLGSKTPGHPEFEWTPGVEATTGPLGQGSANGVGMAIAERYLASRYNSKKKLVDHNTYVLVSDGDLMEGVSTEAASLAGQLKLGKLIYLYDSNNVTLDGPTSLSFTEDVKARYISYGWQVLEVLDGDTDLEAIDRAIVSAKAEMEKPTLVIVKTTIGFGSPGKQGTSKAHGSPLGPEEVEKTRKQLEWRYSPFEIPAEVYAHFKENLKDSDEKYSRWNEDLKTLSKSDPDIVKEWKRIWNGDLPGNWTEKWKKVTSEISFSKPVATRKTSGEMLNRVAELLPEFLGGDADLSVSTSTAIKGAESFRAGHWDGRNIHFGVREHAMGSIVNGICYHGGLRPFAATFFCFSDYMRPPVRLAAMNHLPAIFIWTHDSIGLGEDGPTHQPIEHLASLRALPNLTIIRPADARETVAAWKFALENRKGPTGLVLSRQDLPVLEGEGIQEAAEKGAYILKENSVGKKPEVILIGTGSEVHLALQVFDILKTNYSVRVVSMPCWELFAVQSEEYRDQILPRDVRLRVAIESGSSFGWQKWVGDTGLIFSVDEFGRSAPKDQVYEAFGLTPEKIAAKVKSSLTSA